MQNFLFYKKQTHKIRNRRRDCETGTFIPKHAEMVSTPEKCVKRLNDGSAAHTTSQGTDKIIPLTQFYRN